MFLQVPKNSSLCWASHLTAHLLSTKCQSPFITVSVSVLCSRQEHFLSHSLCIKILIFLHLSLQFLMWKMLTLTSSLCTATVWTTWQMIWQVGTQKRLVNCMCLRWIISPGAASCSLVSAESILQSSIATWRSTAITHHEWLLWTLGETWRTQS